MLPLHLQFKNLLLVFIPTFLTFASCLDRSDRNLAIIKTLNESLINSNEMLAASTDEILTSLEMKRRDPGTSAAGELMYSKAKLVRNISSDTYDYLEKIETALLESVAPTGNVNDFFRQGENHLYDSLATYKSKLLAIDPKIHHQFKNSLVVFTPSFDSGAKSKHKFVKRFFDNSDAIAAIAMLNKLQNNIRLNENRIITFCHENIATHPHYRLFSIILAQSSTIVQAGDQIEIIAGVASIDTDQTPKIFVFNKQISLESDGIAHYKLTATSKPGKYYVPVKISYTDQDGKSQTVEREIIYTVAEIVKKEK